MSRRNLTGTVIGCVILAAVAALAVYVFLRDEPPAERDLGRDSLEQAPTETSAPPTLTARTSPREDSRSDRMAYAKPVADGNWVSWEDTGLLVAGDQLIVVAKRGTTIDEVSTALEEVGSLIVGEIPSVGIYQVELPAGLELQEAIEPLEQLSEVEEAFPNAQAELSQSAIQPPNDPWFGHSAYLQEIKAPEAWAIHTGSEEVIIGIVDTGVDEIPDLRSKIKERFDLGNPKLKKPNTSPDRPAHFTLQTAMQAYHGTAVAGVAAAAANNNDGMTGVSWESPLAVVKVWKGGQALFNVVAGIDAAIDLDAKVINVSAGVPVLTAWLTGMEPVIERAARRNVLIVAAGANHGILREIQYSLGAFPAWYADDHRNVIAVGSTANGKGTFEGGYGASIKVSAPGGIVGYSPFLEGRFAQVNGSRLWFGTSFATPQVSGLAALIWSVDFDHNGEFTLSPAEVREIITETATTPPPGETRTGAGVINAAAALRRAAEKLGVSLVDPDIKPTPRLGTQLEYDISESSVEFGDSFTLAVRMYGLQQAGEHGGISVSFPALTDSGGSERMHSSSRANVEMLDYTTGLSNVTFYQPGATIYRDESGEPTPFPAEHLLVESDDPSWSMSDDRTLRLRITPGFIGEFPILIRGWVCAEEYTDCSRNPDAGTVTDQQGWIVEQVSVQVENFELPPLDPHYSQWERFIKPGVHENPDTYIPQISDFGAFDSYVEDGSFLVRLTGRRKFEFGNTVVGFRTWLYHEGSGSYEVGVSGDDGVALYANDEFVAGRGNAEDPASYGPLALNNGWNKIEALVYNGPLSLSLKLEPALSKFGVIDAGAYYGAPAPGKQNGTTTGRTPEVTGDAIRLLGGRINGQSLIVDPPTISVTSGEAISGVAIISVTNAHRSHAVFPVGATPSWGPHESSYWTIDGWAAALATSEYEVPINLTAPMEPGTYAIIFAAAAETSLAHVMSATHWASGSPTWDDGDDIAGWNTLKWDSAIRHGFVIAPHFGKSSERFGAAVIRIEVAADPAVKGMQTRFASVSAGGIHTCGVRRDGSVACWGNDSDDGRATPPAGEFASVSAGGIHTCGVRRDGAVDCWGDGDYGQATPPSGEFASVSAGEYHTCGVRRDGAVACWGDDRDDTRSVVGQATPPSGEFASVTAGSFHTCGVRRDGSVACWGADRAGQATPPSGEFASVTAGSFHTCGVRRDGSVACWGHDFHGQATPPSGEFASVSAGLWHTCGVQRDGAVACWGHDNKGQATPPSGGFASVSAGSSHTCGVRRDGTVACWGYDWSGRVTAPAGEFASVSTGFRHTCGVRRNGSVACWGYDPYDEARAPAGEFSSVSAGYGHTCGVRTDGSVACWGSQARGLTQADFE